MESTDGLEWTEIETTGFPSSVDTIKYINDRFFVEDYYLYWSTDGREWLNTGMTGSITYGNGKWVNLSFEWTDYEGNDAWSSVYSVSSDLETWSEPALAILGVSKYVVPELKGFLYAENRFVAVEDDNACYSSNGTSWTALPGVFNSETNSLVYGASYFLAYGNWSNGQLYRSSSGTSWSEVTDTDLSTITINDICYGSRFVAVGDDGEIRYGTSSSTWYDATVPSDVVEDINAVAYGNGVYVAVGNKGAILRSTDGISWSVVDITGGNPVYQVFSEVNNVAYGNGVYVACNEHSGAQYSSGGTLSNWKQAKNDSGNDISYEINPVYNNGVFISGRMYSNDGADWFSLPYVSSMLGNREEVIANSKNRYSYVFPQNMDGDAYDIYYAQDSSGWQKISGASFEPGTIIGDCLLGDYTFVVIDCFYGDKAKELIRIDSNVSVTETRIDSIDIFNVFDWKQTDVNIYSFDGKIYILVSEMDGSGSYTPTLGVSDDLGESWSLVGYNSAPASATHFCSIEGYVVAIDNDGDSYYSTNGIDWQECGNVGIGEILDFKFSDDRFVVSGTDGIAYWIPEAS